MVYDFSMKCRRGKTKLIEYIAYYEKSRTNKPTEKTNFNMLLAAQTKLSQIKPDNSDKKSTSDSDSAEICERINSEKSTATFVTMGLPKGSNSDQIEGIFIKEEPISDVENAEEEIILPKKEERGNKEKIWIVMDRFHKYKSKQFLKNGFLDFCYINNHYCFPTIKVKNKYPKKICCRFSRIIAQKRLYVN